MLSDGTRLRGEFLLDPNVTFLNHGSFGATPRAVFERYQEWQRELERQPVLFLARRLDALLAEARAELGAYVGADPDDLVFVPNATAGVNVAAWPLGLQQGDEVLSTDLEYGALDLTWEHVCGDFGARYVRTPVRLPVASADEIVEAVWAGVGPRTRALFLSHHTSSTAMTLPVRELCGRAREAGIRTIVDGAHVPGHLPLNLRELDADYYAGNCHKWQLHFKKCLARLSWAKAGQSPCIWVHTAYYVPDLNMVRFVGDSASATVDPRGAIHWLRLDAQARGILDRIAAPFQPTPAPSPSTVLVGGEAVQDPASYLRLWSVGKPTYSWPRGGFLKIKVTSDVASPWTDESAHLSIARRRPFLLRDSTILRIPAKLAQQIRARVSIR
jgi:hypothetical protein